MEAEWSRQTGTPTTSKVLEQRLSIEIHRITAELPHSSKLEPRNPVGPRRIPIELSCLSYEEGSWQARRPSVPQSLVIVPARLCLATTLWMRALQVEFPKCGVRVDFHHEQPFIEAEGSLYQLNQVVWRRWMSRRPSMWPTGYSTWVPPTSSVGYPLWTDVATWPSSVGLNRLKD
jgi:hypothetical protein